MTSPDASDMRNGRFPLSGRHTSSLLESGGSGAGPLLERFSIDGPPDDCKLPPLRGIGRRSVAAVESQGDSSSSAFLSEEESDNESDSLINVILHLPSNPKRVHSIATKWTDSWFMIWTRKPWKWSKRNRLPLCPLTKASYNLPKPSQTSHQKRKKKTKLKVWRVSRKLQQAKKTS